MTERPSTTTRRAIARDQRILGYFYTGLGTVLLVGELYGVPDIVAARFGIELWGNRFFHVSVACLPFLLAANIHFPKAFGKAGDFIVRVGELVLRAVPGKRK